jgi:transcriptional regulator with XRE-family HTH domain
MKGSTLAATLRALLDEQHLTLDEVASRAGVKRGTIGGWLSGVSPRNLEDARKVAGVLGVSFHYLCFGCEETDPLVTLKTAPSTVVLDGTFRLKLERIEGRGSGVDPVLTERPRGKA